MAEVTLYGKPGCCLCDEARAVVAAVREEEGFDLTEVDVSIDPVLHNRYGERIPVVAIDGVDVLELHVDADALRIALGRVGR
jgi:glutaredoxin